MITHTSAVFSSASVMSTMMEWFSFCVNHPFRSRIIVKTAMIDYHSHLNWIVFLHWSRNKLPFAPTQQELNFLQWAYWLKFRYIGTLIQPTEFFFPILHSICVSLRKAYMITLNSAPIWNIYCKLILYREILFEIGKFQLVLNSQR